MASRSGGEMAAGPARASSGAGYLFLRAAVYAGVPAAALICRYALHADISPFDAILISAALVVPAVRKRTTPSRGWSTVHAVIFGVTGALILMAILITPFRSYEEWFRVFGSALNSGTAPVSNLFVVVTTYFAALLFPTSLSVGPVRAAAGMGMVLLFLAGLITQNIYVCALFAVSAIGLLAVGRRSRNVVIVGAVATAVAIAFAGLPAKSSRDYIDLNLSPALRRAVLSFDPEFPLLYDVSRAATTFHEKKLGGVPVLTGKPIFEVTGDPGATYYIRTDILDEYTGSAWKISSRVLHGGTRYRRATKGWRDDVKRLKLKVLAGNLDLVPTTLDTIGVVTHGVRRDIVEGNYDTGFRLSQPIARDQTITLVRVAEVAPYMREELKRAYLQIPAELPDQVRNLANVLQEDTSSPQEILKKIQNYLAHNYSYTLSSVATNGTSKDFVDTFLFHSSAGYCVNFASAFVILARLDGIPARYATGYLAHIPSSSDQATVTEMTSHAWPEVWLDGRGWATFEATPAVDPTSYHQDANGQWVYDYSIQEDGNTARQLADILGHNVAPAPAAASQSPDSSPSGPALWPVLIGGAGILLVLGGLLFLVVARRRRYTPQQLLERRFYRELRRAVQHFERKTGLPGPSNSGWIAWMNQARHHLNGQAGSVEEFTAMAIRHLYAGQPLPVHALQAARTARKSLRFVPGLGIRHQFRVGLRQMTQKR